MCYSDHNEDIRTKGTCDYCGSERIEDEDDLYERVITLLDHDFFNPNTWK